MRRACPASRGGRCTSLRFIARSVVPHLDPADAPLPRQRAKASYAPAEIDGYLALAAAQPTAARRSRAAGLVCPGAGAGLIRSDLRNVRGTAAPPASRQKPVAGAAANQPASRSRRPSQYREPQPHQPVTAKLSQANVKLQHGEV